MIHNTQHTGRAIFFYLIRAEQKLATVATKSDVALHRPENTTEERILEVAFVQSELRAGLPTWRGQDVRRQQHTHIHTGTHIHQKGAKTASERQDNFFSTARTTMLSDFQSDVKCTHDGRTPPTRRHILPAAHTRPPTRIFYNSAQLGKKSPCSFVATTPLEEGKAKVKVGEVAETATKLWLATSHVE